MFDCCNKRVCTKVDIKDDCYVETLEAFMIKVEVVTSDNELMTEPSERQIIIEDRDSRSFYRLLITSSVLCVYV